MRCHPGSYRLSFLLPAGTHVDSGIHQPSPDGCLLRVDRMLVEISGPSREAVFEHATRLLRVSALGRPPLSIAATLSTPTRPPGRDTWSIIVGADVAFSPTSLDPHLPGPDQARPPPDLEVASGRRR
jgi:hypothetical protein